MAKVRLKEREMSVECGEAYKALRTNVQFCGENKKTIVLTSCTPDEGKSTISLQLAVSLAEANEKVLFIDADLRKSVMMGSFELEEEVEGLTHYLAGRTSFSKIVQETDYKNLEVIFAGPVPPNPAELLGDKTFREMLKKCREEYDYVIIDSPPLGGVIDSAVIAKECDGAIIVIEAEAISYKFAQEIKMQLEKSGCPILGTILNKVDMKKQKYYGKKHGHYYGYGHYE